MSLQGFLVELGQHYFFEGEQPVPLFSATFLFCQPFPALLFSLLSSFKVFDNSWDGFEKLAKWLNSQSIKQVHACLEATSTYGHPVATYLHNQGQVVSIVNPARIKGFAQSQLSRTKNDRADATIIARFCRALEPEAWTPPEPEVSQLQAYSRRLAALEQMKTQENNRLKTVDPSLKEDIEAHIAFLR